MSTVSLVLRVMNFFTNVPTLIAAIADKIV